MNTIYRIGWMSLVLVTAGLSGGCRSAYYSTMEKFGVYKRDILKKKVEEASKDQKQASKTFKDALTHLKELYQFEGGDLEKNYNRFKDDYDDAVARADDVHKRIDEMETVAHDLFQEWEKELEQISSSTLRSRSRAELRETKDRYESLRDALVKAEKSMDPVLTQFRDHVLFLKHNLNAQAIASLKGEAEDIQAEITKLLVQMNSSIEEADAFIKALP